MKLDDALPKQPSESSEISENKWNISLPKTRIHTLQELIEYCEVDLGIWEVDRFTANKWESSAKNADDEVVVTPLFQVKASLKKRVEMVDARKEIEALKDLAKLEAPKPITIQREKKSSGNMLEINIPDAHFGKLAWGEETGGSNYDTKIADELFEKAFETLLQRTAVHDFDEILFVVGNDILQSDTPEGQTYKGTQVSCDGRYHKTFRVVRTRIIACIERLRTRAKKVKVVMVPGNHDTLSVWHLGDSLECYFHHYKDVEIDNSPRYRKYHKFGNVMLCFTHGDKGKKDRMPLLVATEMREMFGATKFCEIHTGHLHKTQLEEQNGIRVRILPALCPADEWHSSNGFVGNQRNAEAYVWSATEGLIGMALYSQAGA